MEAFLRIHEVHSIKWIWIFLGPDKVILGIPDSSSDPEYTPHVINTTNTTNTTQQQQPTQPIFRSDTSTWIY